MNPINKIELRNLKIEDYKNLVKAMTEAYDDPGIYWKEREIKSLLDIFPEGQLVVIADDIVVGCALSLIVKESFAESKHTYKQVVANNFKRHTDEGEVLYGIEVFVHPEFRGLRIGRRLYDARKELCEKLNLQAIIFAGRIPNYNQYSDELSPKEYIEKVRKKKFMTRCCRFN